MILWLCLGLLASIGAGYVLLLGSRARDAVGHDQEPGAGAPVGANDSGPGAPVGANDSGPGTGAAHASGRPRHLTHAEQARVLHPARGLAALHATKTHTDFDAMDAWLCGPGRLSVAGELPVAPFACYPCQRSVTQLHPHYTFSCRACGDKFWAARHLTRDLQGRAAFVTGGRTKLGHQVVLKLLRAGATVFATTRSPGAAVALFRQYPDSPAWLARLHVLPLDMMSADLATDLAVVTRHVRAVVPHVDVVVNCAAQTIRVRDRRLVAVETLNRYGDAAHVPAGALNSWDMRVPDVVQAEAEELFRVNAVAPLLVVQAMLPLMRDSEEPYVINVHAREGVFDVVKSDKHIHTNMAKAAMAMFTCTLANTRKRYGLRARLRVHGCDPGWISLDEYAPAGCPFVVPPLDERDGAARVLYPLWKRLQSRHKTRRHFDWLIF
jgi:NAD(P)-dependent dehydrogenase (short-subunit alcohol dehydrogenase family)